MDGIALLLHHDMDADGLVQLDAIVVDEALGFEAPVDPFGDGAPHLDFGELEQTREAGERIRLAEFCDQLATRCSPSRLAPSWPRMSPSTSSGVRRIGGDDALDLEIALAAAVIANGRQMQAFVEDFARLARTRAGHRAADVALVRDGAAEADQLALDKRPA